MAQEAKENAPRAEQQAGMRRMSVNRMKRAILEDDKKRS